jgi:isopenicillin-N N-acyltransferase-like protein
MRMRVVRLEPSLSAFDRGERHGRALGDEIAEIGRIRSELACSQGKFRSDAELLRVAELHLPLLQRYDQALYDELCGIAVGSDQPAARIVVLNHYTDLKDLDPAVVLPDSRRPPAPPTEPEDDCSAIAAATSEGALLGQTWDMHGSAGRFVIMLHVPPMADRPEAWLLSIAGCLGMAGMNVAGLGVTINNLRSDDARVGLVWPALVRRALAERTAEDARRVVQSAPLGSGHHYLVADARRAIGIETSGQLSDAWMEIDMTRVGAAFHHENHCLGVPIAAVSSISPVSTTLARHAWLEESLKKAPVHDRADLWARLGSHEGYPRSICTHLATPEQPHAMQTCAGLVMNLTARRMWAVAGCVHGAEPTELRFDGADR